MMNEKKYSDVKEKEAIIVIRPSKYHQGKFKIESPNYDGYNQTAFDVVDEVIKVLREHAKE